MRPAVEPATALTAPPLHHQVRPRETLGKGGEEVVVPVAVDVPERDRGLVPALAVELHRERGESPGTRPVGGQRQHAQALALEQVELVGGLRSHHENRHAVDLERPALVDLLGAGQGGPELHRRPAGVGGVEEETAQSGAADRLRTRQVELPRA